MKLREGFAMFVLIALALILLTGCASEQAYRDYTIAYTGYINSQTAKGNEVPKLVEIVAKDGETIEMKGVKSFVVYSPSAVVNQAQPPQQIKNSEWVGTVNNIVSGGMALGSTAVLGSVIKSVVNSAGENAGHNTTVNTTGSYNTENTSSISDSGNTTTTNTNSGNTISDSGNTTETTTTTTNTTTTNNNDDHSNNNSNNDNSAVY